MAYVEGFVIPIAKKNLPAYWKMARKCAKIWLELGALEYRECVGDDLAAKMGLPFPKRHECKASETIIFSWITYKTKADRKRVSAKVMKDPRIAAMCDPNAMPFDMNRMCVGGFQVKVSAG